MMPYRYTALLALGLAVFDRHLATVDWYPGEWAVVLFLYVLWLDRWLRTDLPKGDTE